MKQESNLTSTERKGSWLQTYTGTKYWPLDPRAEEVNIEDIAHALSNVCRYAGHTSRFYSVAEHSVLVSKLVAPELALQGLLHDATEAYILDVPRPLKPYLTNYAEIEELNWKVIAEKFNVDVEMHPSVKHADNAILVKEMSVLMRGTKPRSVMSGDMGTINVPEDMYIIGMLPEWSKAAFLGRFAELTTLRR